MRKLKLFLIIFTSFVVLLIIITCNNSLPSKIKLLYISKVIPAVGLENYGEITITSNYETSTDLSNYEIRSVTKLEVTNDTYYLQKWAFFPTDSSIDAKGNYVIDGSSDLAVTVYELANSGVTIYLKDASSEIIDTYNY